MCSETRLIGWLIAPFAEVIKGCTWYHNETSDMAQFQHFSHASIASRLELPVQEPNGKKVSMLADSKKMMVTIVRLCVRDRRLMVRRAFQSAYSTNYEDPELTRNSSIRTIYYMLQRYGNARLNVRLTK